MLDYDLVILGGSLTGRYAALLASQMQARVALVEPKELTLTPEYQGLFPIAASIQSQHQVFLSKKADSEINFKGKTIKRWLDLVRANQTEIYSPQRLATGGIDVIVGEGEFIESPRLRFSVNNRVLRSRNYLLALAPQPKIPAIEGLLSTGFITPNTLDLFLQKQPNLSETVAQRLAIIGGDPAGVELAQVFTRLGVEVILVVEGTQILAQEEPEAVQLIQGKLEAEGVKILTQTPVIQVKKIEDKKWIQAGNTALEVDEILLACGSKIDLEPWNFSLINVKFKNNHLWVNEKLQTTNPRIYGCGEILGGYSFEHIAQYEAQIALKNALYWPRFTVNYQSIPWAIFSHPQFARVGFTETQAKNRYGTQVIVERQSLKQITQAQIWGETTGFCKLVGLSNGKLLGATVVGSQASELIHTLALAIRQGVNLKTLAECPAILPTFSEVYHQSAIAWINQRRRQNTVLFDWIENLFHWRRYWGN
ncbi:dihydrolipoyl dehydrogenase family protein [Planktothrix pseudagardhii]|uniref:Dihydrolipoyl dehydrogenase n=1 Tax=Planktothrix pseudagardhii TaxID=132604 RepID=A0A9W4CSZ4_9CYAN|nr:NAD(P)/FAD-dependent oxidoreductase [Planktothrix pseudagardhii]CAD5983364.1 Dihydrolipoyl dehydrogenase [Planktothrix pseudagardhii]